MTFYESTIIMIVFLSLGSLITGLWFKIRPPKKINMIFGYKTMNSTKSQKHWDFAHLYSGNLLILFGFIFPVITLFLNIIEVDENLNSLFVIIIFIIGNILIIYKTEKAIEERFKGNQ